MKNQETPRKARDLLRETTPLDWSRDIPSPPVDAASIKSEILGHFNHTLGRDFSSASANYVYLAVAMTVRDRVMERWRTSRAHQIQTQARKTCYLSLEFLMGRALSNALLNTGLTESVQQALEDLGMDLGDIEELEADAGLGNGGLGRLAACFLDSCATLGLPVLGYGIRYHYGMFRQHIENGYQIEEPDNWLRNDHAWEIERPEIARIVRFGGHTIARTSDDYTGPKDWANTDDVLAVPFDVPIPGYRNGIVNTLRLWSASATDEFNLADFNAGSYTASVAAKNAAENITMVLYPNDASENGKQLRLQQQYFLVSASLQDVVRQWRDKHDDMIGFADKHCFQLNDTHPSLAVPELMRILIDEENMLWDEAWSVVTSTMAYTNHTLLPEALERWSTELMTRMLPRIVEIIQVIDARFNQELETRWPDDPDIRSALSIIDHENGSSVRMAHLAVVGSYSVNGVAQLHSDLLRQGLFNRFYELWPEKFNNKTNGVTQRRWLAQCNPPLRSLLNETIGDGWITDLDQLKGIQAKLDDEKFCERWRAVKLENKERLSHLVRERCGVEFNTSALFDVQVKRMHEYKRQLLNALHAVHLYLRIKEGDTADWTPRCILIGGKAAPGYEMAKAIIKLINNVATVINSDPLTRDKLKLVFLPDYNVSAMEIICAATDLSEQISTAGKEASGTGNMKFMMNGALTIGTLDGANVEIREAVGDENFFLFGLTEAEVVANKADYKPEAIINADPRLKAVFDALRSNMFNRHEPHIFDSILDAALSPDDQWMTVADMASFFDSQQAVAEAYRDEHRWTRMSIINSANSGRFSTDRTMREYNEEIWRLESLSAESGQRFGRTGS